MFAQQSVQAQIKENIKATRHWPVWGESTDDWWITLTKGQLRGKCFYLITTPRYYKGVMRSGKLWMIFILYTDIF